MKTFFSIVIFSSMLLIACGDDAAKKDDALPALLNAQSPTNDTSAQTNTQSGVALNPQHGQPGHRCDIAVGAPLNSTASTATSTVAVPPTQPVNTPTITTSAPALTPNTAELKFNPKHGEPGHRCDLAEGAALDTKKQ